MTEHYADLGAFSDWVAHERQLRRQRTSAPRTGEPLPAVSGAHEVAQAVGRVLQPLGPEQPLELRRGQGWEQDGVVGEELSWSAGFGPRTQAWLLRPAGEQGPLPGVLALHGHDGVKRYGKEKIADGPGPVAPAVHGLRETYYSGRAWANDLARQGFAVLVPDVFLWGSRRFALGDMPPLMTTLGERTAGVAPPDETPAGADQEVVLYNAAAWHHEHVVEKYCRLLGTTLAAVVAREDRIALAALRAQPDVLERVGAVGLSGGGARSALLRATATVDAAVVVGMMSTYDALLDHDVVNHTWMLMPGDLPGQVDWPDVVGHRAPAPLMVQYARGDQILPWAGAQEAHRRLVERYTAAGATDAYAAHVVDGGHAFTSDMQRVAFAWLREHLHAR